MKLNQLTGAQFFDFCTYLEARNQRGDSKNLKLARLLYEGKTEDLDLALYGKPAKAALAGLKHRLQRNFYDYLGWQELRPGGEDNHLALVQYHAARSLLRQASHRDALRLIHRAIQTAREAEQYEVLHRLLALQLEHFHVLQEHDLAIGLEELLQEIKNAKEASDYELRLATGFQVLNQRLKSPEYVAGLSSLSKAINDALAEFEVQLDHRMGPLALSHVVDMTLRLAQERFTLREAEPVLHQVVLLLGNVKHQAADIAAGVYLQLAWATMRIGFTNEERAFQWQVLEQHALNLQPQLSQENLERHHRLLVWDAIVRQDLCSIVPILNQRKTEETILWLALIAHLQQDARDAYRKLAVFLQQPAFKRLSVESKFLVHLQEVALHLDLKNDELAQSRLRSLRTRFKAYIKQQIDERIVQYLNHLNRYMNRKPDDDLIQMHTAMRNDLITGNAEAEDLLAMMPYAWLTARLTGTTTLYVLRSLISSEEKP